MNSQVKKLWVAGGILMGLQFASPIITTGAIVIPVTDERFHEFHSEKISCHKVCHAHKLKRMALSTADSKNFFTLNVNKGDKLGNIFTRTISYKSKTDSFTEVAYRVGGTGIYTVLDNDPAKPVFDGVFRYDGRPESHGKVEISDNGRTNAYNGKASLNTDGSGLMYNSFIWGTPPTHIKSGDTWRVDLTQPWELGGIGTQTVTVVNIDEKNNTVKLKREGTSEGFYDNDAKKISITKDGKTIKVDVAPGTSHWVGYTIFKNGLVVSDELLVTRPVTLTADNLKFDALEREYILLNEMPV